MTTLRIGLVGANPDYGWGGSVHVPAIRSAAGVELTAIATRSRTSADAAAAAFGVRLAFDDASALARHADIDAIAVAVRAPEHRAIVEAALAAGKHVFCEWPLGSSLAESRELAGLAARTPAITTAIGLQGRFSPWLRQVRDLVRSGAVGRVMSSTMIASDLFSTGSISASNAYALEPENGVNALTIHVGHFLDSFCFVLGEVGEMIARTATTVPEVTVSETGEMRRSMVPDQIVMAGILDEGGVAVVQTRAGRPADPAAVWEIQGADGLLRITSPDGYLHWHPLTIELARGGGPFATLPAPYLGLGDAPALPVAARHVALAYEAFARDIGSGARSSATFDDAVMRHEVIAAIEEAAHVG